MRILIVANHYAVASGRYASDAFRRLGHEVYSTGQAMGRDIWGMRLPEGSEWIPDCFPGLKFLPPNLDLIVVMDSDPAILDAAKELVNVAPIVVWGVDNHCRDYRRPYIQHYFLAHRNVSVMDWRNDMTHLPCAYDPVLHTPSPIPYRERQYDVALLGVLYPSRWAAVQELRAAGLSVIAGAGLIGEAYRDVYHNARISLCLSACGDVAQRVFETAAMSCLVVSDPCPDYDILKPEGICILDRERSLVEQIKDSLAGDEMAQTRIEWAQEWVKNETWDARAQQIVQWWESQQ